MRTFIEKSLFFILISIFLAQENIELSTIFLGFCIYILSLSPYVSSKFISSIALGISGILCILFPQTGLYSVLFIMHAVHLYGLGGIFSGIILFLHPNLFTFILGIIGSYIMLQTQKDEAFQKKNYQIQNDLELERLKLVQRQQSSSEEILKQMEIATLKERNRISHALHDQLGHTLSASIMQLEALQIITTEPVVEEKLEHLSSILQQEMDNIRLTIHQMYDDSFSLSQRMDTLLQPLKEKAQMNFTNTISDSIPITIKYDILTICKELTTNFMKHSNGTQLQLFLLEQKTTYTIDYRDNGNRPTTTPSGMGLTMMKELVEKHNGDFTLQTKNGYEIFIRIPKQEASHD